jgi:hypothetical protein
MPKRKNSELADAAAAIKEELLGVGGAAAADGASGPNKKAAAAAAAAKTPAKPTTPFDRLWERLDANIDEEAEGDLKGLGRMMIRGVEAEKAEADYTEEDMGHMRFIIVTQRRADEQDRMRELLLGEDSDSPFLMFNTSFSYQVLDSLQDLQRGLKQCKQDWARKFDRLLGYTTMIDQYDVWMHDHEVGWGGHRFIAALARQWKAVLQQSDAALGIDGEFTRPGAVCLLENFKAKVEDIDQYGGEPKIKFNFQ